MANDSPPATNPSQILHEGRRRRTIAVISHPDAGKSTLTESILSAARAISSPGAIHGKRGSRTTVSDWMAMEQERGISVSSAAVRFDYRDHVINIVDTPGHADFSEDTYRVLSAVDAAVMLLDAAKGIEAQTMKLFEVCRLWRLPVITVINKWDRPGREALDLLDEVLARTGMMPVPLNWPVGPAGLLQATIDLAHPDRVMTHETGQQDVPIDRTQAAARFGADWQAAVEEVELIEAEHRTYDRAEFLAGVATPVIFGAALREIGVRRLLDLIVDDAPSAQPRVRRRGGTHAVDSTFSGQVFKVQSGTNANHHDRIAFLRVCSGRFVRGDVVQHAQSGRPLATKYAQQVFGQSRTTADEAWPGDIVGLVNASLLRPGDTLHGEDSVEFSPLPAFAPEHFASVDAIDSGRQKQFRRGLRELDEEGVIQLLTSDRRGTHAPLLGAVGPLQFDVASERMKLEFGVRIALHPVPYSIARRTDAAGAAVLARLRDGEVVTRTDGTHLVLLPSEWRVRRIAAEFPEVLLEDVATFSRDDDSVLDTRTVTR